MIREDDLKAMHDKLLAEQEKLEPYLTLGRMGEIMNLKERSGTVRYILNKMVDRGMAKKVKFGLVNRYRIL